MGMIGKLCLLVIEDCEAWKPIMNNIWSITFSSPFCCKVTSMWAFRVGSYVICFDLHIFQFLAGFEFDYVFDWTILKYKQTQRTKPPAKSPVSYSNLLFFKYFQWWNAKIFIHEIAIFFYFIYLNIGSINCLQIIL
jgi:hypothetical protein